MKQHLGACRSFGAARHVHLGPRRSCHTQALGTDEPADHGPVGPLRQRQRLSARIGPAHDHHD
jgi:hypothetical protein